MKDSLGDCNLCGVDIPYDTEFVSINYHIESAAPPSSHGMSTITVDEAHVIMQMCMECADVFGRDKIDKILMDGVFKNRNAQE